MDTSSVSPGLCDEAVFNSVVDRLRIARDRRKQRQELIEYLTSDHRAANDLGITTYNVRNFFR